MDKETKRTIGLILAFIGFPLFIGSLWIWWESPYSMTIASIGLVILFIAMFLLMEPDKRNCCENCDDSGFDDADHSGDEYLGLEPGALNPDDDFDDRRDY